MEGSALAWLATKDGKELLANAQSMPPDRLTRVTRLRKQVSASLAGAAVELIELRERGSAKFGIAGEMLFTPIGLEQSTGDRIAMYRSTRFPNGVCIHFWMHVQGSVGDAMQFAIHRPVLAVDRDHASCVCASYNSSIQTGRCPVRTVCTDVTDLDLDRLRAAGFQSAFLDPGRRRFASGGTTQRARNPEEYSHPLSWMQKLREVFTYVCAKASPLIDDRALQSYRAAVEFISDRGECKEALLWAGEFEDSFPPPNRDHLSDSFGYRATLINSTGEVSTLKPISCSQPTVGDPAGVGYLNARRCGGASNT